MLLLARACSIPRGTGQRGERVVDGYPVGEEPCFS